MNRLHSAHVTQHNKGDWHVRENITKKEIFKLPSTMDEQQVFAALALARQTELEAFNYGIEFGKRLARNKDARVLEKKLLFAAEENTRLAAQLDRLIGAKE